MIVTDLTHIAGQIAMTPNLRKGLDFLEGLRGSELPPGKVEIDGDRVYASVQAFNSIVTDSPKMEAHIKYIDIQFVLSGEEVIVWAPLEKMTVTKPYDKTKDSCNGTVQPQDLSRFVLRAGQLAVFYPEDAHGPKLAVGASMPVSKIVVKAAR